ncbi:Uncharacterised protein [uncultured archaeon]|nr:Uncharacterised protein [uncultured archaeon]
MKAKLDFKRLAKYEIGWWQAHHRRDKAKFVSNQVKKHAMLFGVSEKKARKAMEYFFRATKEHDIAEEFEDRKVTKKANIHWKRAETLLKKHFRELLKR